MKLALIVAMSRDGLIGREGALPWRLPRDLKHFRRLTWGKPIIMGRRTHEALGRPLPGRTNIVLTRQAEVLAKGCLVARDRTQALALAQATGSPEALIIGGSQVYEAFLPLKPTIHLTLVEGTFTGDAFFPFQSFQSAPDGEAGGNTPAQPVLSQEWLRAIAPLYKGTIQPATGIHLLQHHGQCEWEVLHAERWPADAENPHDASYLVLSPKGERTG